METRLIVACQLARIYCKDVGQDILFVVFLFVYCLIQTLLGKIACSINIINIRLELSPDFSVAYSYSLLYNDLKTRIGTKQSRKIKSDKSRRTSMESKFSVFEVVTQRMP